MGFIPLGAVMYCWLLQSNVLHKRYELVAIVAGCFLFSLAVESTQMWLPFRHSSVLDVLCNTLGAYLGVLLLMKARKRWFPFLANNLYRNYFLIF